MDIVDGQLNSLVDAIKNLLGKFADKSGVTVNYHATKPIVRFTFKTEDKLAIDIKYDVNQTSEEYIGNMVLGVQSAIQKKRKERHDSPIILLA